jgi:pentapeptide MXKDX repeat protein
MATPSSVAFVVATPSAKTPSRKWRATMRRLVLGLSCAALVACVGFGIAGCDSSETGKGGKMGTEKMSSDKMSGGKMDSDKMGSDKMGSDKMSSDKMSADKMGSDKHGFRQNGLRQNGQRKVANASLHG